MNPTDLIKEVLNTEYLTPEGREKLIQAIKLIENK